MPEACKTASVSPAGRVQAWSLVVGGNPGSRAVVFPIPRVGLLEETTSGLRKAREDATRRVAMSSGGRHSGRTGCEDHEGSVGHQFGSMR